MNVTTELLMPNVIFTCLNTTKFKTGCMSVNLLCPLSRATASKNALIPFVLKRGTATLPDMTSVAVRLDALYGARLRPVIRKKGEIQAVGFYADFADDAFIPEKGGLPEQMTELLGQMLLIPNTHGGLLRSEYVESEKEKLLQKIRGRINDKRSYSVQRLMELMCSMESYAVPGFGTEAEAESITHTDLSKHYKEILSSSPLHIFYCGSAEPERVKTAILDALSGLPRRDEEPELGTDVRMNSLEAETRFFEDKLAVTQGKLAMGFRLGDCMEDPDTAAIRVFNAVYGGSVTSKLFMNVREKLSLCYFASSFVDLHKGIMGVSSGIEFDKFEAAKNEILAQLELVKHGDFTEEELSAAKVSVANDYRSAEDSPVALEDFFLNRTLIGPECTPSELAALTEDVTSDQVTAIARGVECDAVYFLRGQEADA